MIGDVFQAESYKTYVIEGLGALGHGSRLRLASALQCQPGYLSQVLNHDAHFSFEQAEDLAQFFKLSVEETEFLFLLIHYARAGSTTLRRRWKEKIDDVRLKRAQISNRVKDTRELDEVSQSTYYSRWFYAALHTLVTVPGKRTRQAMRDYLDLTDEQIMDGLSFLEKTGLIQRKDDEYVTGPFRLHLKSDSPHIMQLHGNWRLRAMDRMRSGDKTNLHYSAAYSLSRADFGRIKESLLRTIEEVRSVVRVSPEEEVCVLGMDFFFPGISPEKTGQE